MNRLYRKNYFDGGKNQQFRNREILRRKLDDAQNFADQIGLEMTVNVNRKTTRSPTRRPVDIIVNNRLTGDDVIAVRKKIIKCLIFKEKGGLSDKKYIMAKANLDFVKMPGKNKLLSFQEKINELIELRAKNAYGVYVNASQKITTACKLFLRQERKTDPNFNVNNFTIKISCDGTIVTRANVNILNLSFTIINDKKRCKTAFGNFILGMFKIKNYIKILKANLCFLN